MTLVSSALQAAAAAAAEAFPLLFDSNVETAMTTIPIPWLDLSLQENDPARLPGTAIWPQPETPFWMDPIKSTQ
jgi:hypothetical protein